MAKLILQDKKFIIIIIKKEKLNKKVAKRIRLPPCFDNHSIAWIAKGRTRIEF